MEQVISLERPSFQAIVNRLNEDIIEEENKDVESVYVFIFILRE